MGLGRELPPKTMGRIDLPGPFCSFQRVKQNSGPLTNAQLEHMKTGAEAPTASGPGLCGPLCAAEAYACTSS